jgi:hypothetical protein
LRRARQVDEFPYLICPNRTQYEKLMKFEKIHDF